MKVAALHIPTKERAVKKFKDIRDEKGAVHNPRKVKIADFVPKGLDRPFEVGDRVYYAGVLKANYGKLGTLTGVRDSQGFYITFDDGSKASTTVGALQLVRAHKPKVEKPKEAKPKKEKPKDFATEVATAAVGKVLAETQQAAS